MDTDKPMSAIKKTRLKKHSSSSLQTHGSNAATSKQVK